MSHIALKNRDFRKLLQGPLNDCTSFVGARSCDRPHHTEKLMLLQFGLLGGRPERSAGLLRAKWVHGRICERHLRMPAFAPSCDGDGNIPALCGQQNRGV
jgi:hypothetical protein